MDITIPERVKIFQSYIKPNDIVLEIGCREGELTHHINAKKIIGLDIDKKILKSARSKNKRKTGKEK